MRPEYTRDELNAMAGRFWERVHRDVPHLPWRELPDYRRQPWRQATLELLRAKEVIDGHHLDAHRAASRRSVRLERAS